jgi:hypothetical protein
MLGPHQRACAVPADEHRKLLQGELLGCRFKMYSHQYETITTSVARNIHVAIR